MFSLKSEQLREVTFNLTLNLIYGPTFNLTLTCLGNHIFDKRPKYIVFFSISRWVTVRCSCNTAANRSVTRSASISRSTIPSVITIIPSPAVRTTRSSATSEATSSTETSTGTRRSRRPPPSPRRCSEASTISRKKITVSRTRRRWTRPNGKRNEKTSR